MCMSSWGEMEKFFYKDSLKNTISFLSIILEFYFTYTNKYKYVIIVILIYFIF